MFLQYVDLSVTTTGCGDPEMFNLLSNPLQVVLNSETCHCNSVDNMVCDHPTMAEVNTVCFLVDEYIELELGNHSDNRVWLGRVLYRNHLMSTRAECRTYASRWIRARRSMPVLLVQEYARANIVQQPNPSDDTFASTGITFIHTHVNTTLLSFDLMLTIIWFRYNICRWPIHCIFVPGCIRPDHSPGC